MPSPPESPPLAAQNSRAPRYTNNGALDDGKGGAAHTIAEECERLFCGTLRAVFSGEGNVALQDPLVMGAQNQNQLELRLRAIAAAQGTTPPADKWLLDGPVSAVKSFVTKWIEVWDYVGGARFRGFTAADGFGVSTLFVFFDGHVVGKDLKQGLMALLELASAPTLECSHLVVCLDRGNATSAEGVILLRDLGWVGFEPITLGQWAGDANLISPDWLLLGMEV